MLRPKKNLLSLLKTNPIMVNSERLVDTFIDLVKLDSPTFKERKVADYIIKSLHSLEIQVEEDDTGQKVNGNCGNIFIRLLGNSTGPKLMFAAHLDTVEPCKGIKPQIKNGVITSSTKTILGADDKSGIAPILELIQIIRENNISHPLIDVIFTVAEEKGLFGSKNLSMDWLQADYGYVLDGDGAPGKIIIRSPYQNTINANIKGKSAHTGIEPEKGINAIQAAAAAISKMELGRIEYWSY